MIEDKKIIRNKLLSLREQLKPEEITEYSQRICQKVLSLKEYIDAKNILLYSNHKNEVNTEKIFINASLDNKKVYYPKVISDDGLMDFFRIMDSKDFIPGYKGIKEPKGDTERFEVKDDFSMIIVPGTGFDTKLYRIGYGKGYYDRYLFDKNIIKVGICFDCQITDSLPIDRYDIRMDYVITESKIYLVKE